MNQQEYARARADCLSRKFDAEVLIYDPQRDVGHCLNSTAAAVWRLCDGKSSPRQIAAELSRQFSAPVEERVVQLALGQLADANLLVERKVTVGSLSRRVAIRRMGIAAAIALPLITSIVAPTPAHAASCLPNGQPCANFLQCCSLICGPLSHVCGNVLSPKSRTRRR
jgi:hypothetical protein